MPTPRTWALSNRRKQWLWMVCGTRAMEDQRALKSTAREMLGALLLPCTVAEG